MSARICESNRKVAEKRRGELSGAYAAQAAELETLRDRLAEVEKQAAAGASAAAPAGSEARAHRGNGHGARHH